MKTKKQVEYDVRTIDEHGDVLDVDSYYSGDARARGGIKRRAIEAAHGIVRDGGTAVVERVVYTMDEDGNEVCVPTYEKIWSGGDHARLAFGGWLVAGDSDSEGGAA